MLVLSRKKGQSIVLDDGKIIITVMEGGNGAVTLGVQAPSSIQIDREEVYRKKLNAAMEAAQYV